MEVKENDKIKCNRKFEFTPSFIEKFDVHKKMSPNCGAHIDMDPNNVFECLVIYPKNCYNNYTASTQIDSSCSASHSNTNFILEKEHFGTTLCLSIMFMARV